MTANPNHSTVTIRARSQASLWRKKAAQQFLKHLVLIALGLLFFFPFAWLVLTSLKSASEIATMPPTILPKQIQWRNYVEAVTYIPFFRYLFNTLLIFAGKAVGAVISCSLAGICAGPLDHDVAYAGHDDPSLHHL